MKTYASTLLVLLASSKAAAHSSKSEKMQQLSTSMSYGPEMIASASKSAKLAKGSKSTKEPIRRVLVDVAEPR